ncbi:MAG: ATP-binding cassette domain-containing protein [Faecalibacillus faecis]
MNKTNIILHGDNIFLLGESGCGKSSIAKCIAGLSNIYTGRILVSDSDNQFKDINKCNVVYLSNESNLFTGTIRENILFRKSCY